MAEINRARMEQAAGVDAARSELGRIVGQIDKLVMAIADGANALPPSAKIENLSSILDGPGCKSEAFDIIRGPIDEVRLIPKNGRLRIELSGELAGIPSLRDKAQKPAASYEERAEKIKVVAGAGFVQAPTIRRAV